MWTPLKGRLDRKVVDSCEQIAVRYFNGQTKIKIEGKDVLYKYNMSTMIKEYKLL